MTVYDDYNNRMMAEAIRRQTAPPPGTISQSTGPSAAAIGAAVDLTGAENSVKSQRDYANMLRGKAAPKGKTVGPSGLYVAPNWGESLEYAVNQGLGGYMAGRANKADARLSKIRETKNADTLAYQAEMLADTREYKTSDRVAGEAADAAAAALTADALAGRSADTNRRGWANVKPVTYGPADGKGEKMLGIPTPGGKVLHPQTGEPLPDNYVVVDENAEAAMAALNASGEPSGGKLFNKRRVIPEDGGKPRMIGQNNDGVMFEEGGSAPVDPNKYKDALTEAQIDTGSTKLKVDLVDINKLNTALGNYKEAFSQFAEGGENAREYGDIPGQGRFSGKDGTVGYLARMAESVVAAANGDNVSPEVIYGLARDISNVQIRDNAGLSQTAAEIARLKPVLEGEFGADPIVVRESIARVMKVMQNELQILRDTLHPQVLDRYNARAGANSLFNTESLEPLKFPDSRSKRNEEAAAGGVNKQLSENRAKQAELKRRIEEESR